MSAEELVSVLVEGGAWAEALGAPEALAQGAVAAVFAAEGKSGPLCVLLTDDAALHALNRDFRGKDAPTNVLAFPAAPPDPSLGDIALGYETLAAEAQAQGKPLRAHAQHLIVHGVLHLLGYDHIDDGQALVMEARERAILAGLGVANPYGADAV